MKILFFISILLLTSSCGKNETDDFYTKNIELTKTIDSYIKENSIKSYVSVKMYENGFSTPSLQVYFNVKNKDTIMSIIRVAFLNDYEIDPHYNSKDDSTLYYVLEPDGSLLFREKYPLIFFNTKYYKKDCLKKYLTQVPDSLKLNKINGHLKPMRKDYKIKNNNITRID